MSLPFGLAAAAPPFSCRLLEQLIRFVIRSLNVTNLTVYKARGEEVPQSFGKYLIEQQAFLGLSNDETAYLAGG